MIFNFYGSKIEVPDYVKNKNAYVKRFINKSVIVSDFYNISKCFYCDNFAKYEIDISDNEVTIFEPIGRACRKDNCFSKKLNPMSNEFLINCKGLSESEAKMFLGNRSKKSRNTAKENGVPNSNSYECLISKGISYEDARLYMVKKSKKSHDTLKANGWYDDKSNNPFSKEFWIKRGFSSNEAQIKVNERNHFCNQEIGINPSKLEYWIHKYGLEDGINLKNKINEKISYSNSLEGYIDKYGLEDGNRKYAEKISKCVGYLKSTSNESIKFFDDLLFELCDKFKYNFYKEAKYGNGSEICIFDEELNTNYFYDFCLGDLIIEYNGDMWHPRLDRLGEDLFNKWSNPYYNMKHIDASYMENRDKRKKQIAIDNGYKFLEIWSSDCKSNYSKQIKNALEFISNEIN